MGPCPVFYPACACSACDVDTQRVSEVAVDILNLADVANPILRGVMHAYAPRFRCSQQAFAMLVSSIIIDRARVHLARTGAFIAGRPGGVLNLETMPARGSIDRD